MSRALCDRNVSNRSADSWWQPRTPILIRGAPPFPAPPHSTVQVMDVGATGRVSWPRFRSILKKFKLDLTDAQARRVFEMWDLDGSGHIDFSGTACTFPLSLTVCRVCKGFGNGVPTGAHPASDTVSTQVGGLDHQPFTQLKRAPRVQQTLLQLFNIVNNAPLRCPSPQRKHPLPAASSL